MNFSEDKLMSHPQPKEFGKWRSILWPIHGFELKKFLPMFFLFFFINFNYTILRDTKDTLIVTATRRRDDSLLEILGSRTRRDHLHAHFTKLSNVVKRNASSWVSWPSSDYSSAFTP